MAHRFSPEPFLPMRLKESIRGLAGYFIRATLEEAERGPFPLEHLADLAEFGNVTPEFLVRREDEAEGRVLRSLPELLAAVFPERKSFRFRAKEETGDTEADFSPVDIHSFYRCEPELDAGALQLSPEAEPVSKRPDPEQQGVDVKALLEANEEVLRAHAPEPAPVERKSWYSVSPGMAAFRWLLAFGCFGLGLWIWITNDSANKIGTVFSLVMGLPFFVVGLVLIVTDILDFFLDRIKLRDVPKAVDCTEADARFAAEDWPGAAAAYLTAMRKDPHQTRIYLRGISAAAAAGKPRQVAAFHASAIKHLGLHDRNLLSGALARKGLPPLSKGDQ